MPFTIMWIRRRKKREKLTINWIRIKWRYEVRNKINLYIYNIINSKNAIKELIEKESEEKA